MSKTSSVARILILIAAVFLLSSTAFANNFVRIDCPVDIPVPSQDTTILIDIYICNDVLLGGFSLGFSYAGDVADEMEIDTVIAGPAIPLAAFIQLKFVPEDNQVLVGYIDFGGFAIQPTPDADTLTGLLAFSLEMFIPAGATAQCFNMDSVFVLPAGPFKFSPKSGGSLFPDYIDCGLGDISIGGASCGGSNTAPLANDTAMTVLGLTATAAQLHANDDDGDDLTFNIESGPANGTLTAFDANTGAFTYQASDACAGSDSFTFTAHDGTDPSNVATVSITIVDNVPPVAICPGDITTGNDTDACNAVVNFAIDATDNCSGVTVVASPVSGSMFPLGTTAVEVIATDAVGLKDTCYFDVTVNDTQDPLAICPAPITVGNDAETCGAVVNFAPSAADNCPGVTVVANPVSGSTFPVGTTAVEVVATDAAANKDTCYFDVTVNDTEYPVAICSDDITVAANPGATSAVVNFAGAIGGSDNCGVTVIASPVSGFAFPLGTTAVEVVATDAADNADTCYFDVTVNARPDVDGIPNQILAFGAEFTTFDLDDYVTDLDNTPAEIDWTYAGNTELTVAIDGDHLVTITKPDPNWIGSEAITFTATDPDALFDSDEAVFSIIVGNAPPVADAIPNQTIFKGASFATITLDDYVADADHADNLLAWTGSSVTGAYNVAIDGNRIATVTVVDAEFIGCDSVRFIVTDPDDDADTTYGIFCVEQELFPDFDVTASPDTIVVTVGISSDIEYTIDVASIDEFSGDVTITNSALPAGVSMAYSPSADVSVPGSTMFTGTSGTEAAVGVYPITFTGMLPAKDGASHEYTVYLKFEECSEPPVIVLSQDYFEFFITEGDDVADEMVYITNDAICGTLFWSANSDQDWVTPDPLSGSVQAGDSPGSELTLLFATDVLPEGNYTAEVMVFDVAKIIGEMITIDLHVSPPAVSNDTVDVANVVGFPGLDVAVPITFKNNEHLAAMSAGLNWNSMDVTLDSVSYVGSRVADISVLIATINNASQNVALGVLRIPPDPSIEPGSGLWATLWFSIDPSAVGVVDIDSVFIVPGVELIFTDSLAHTIYPQFKAGSITIDESPQLISGMIVDEIGLPISNAGVELYDLLSNGGPLATTMSGPDGSYLFDIGTYASGKNGQVNASLNEEEYTVRAYKADYYPGITETMFPASGVDVVLTENAGVVTPTHEWVDLYCEEAFFDEMLLPLGTVIEAFDPTDVLCGQWTVTEVGRFGFMPVYVDDPFTNEDEGCEVDDIIVLRVNGYDINSFLYDGPITWTGNGDRYEACFEGFSIVEKCIVLYQGWNLISWNIDTEIYGIEDIAADVMDNVDVILSFELGAQTYDPMLPEFSTLENTDADHGYWFRMLAEDTLCVEGFLVEVATPINLEFNWNLVSYRPDDPLMVEDALANIWSVVDVVLGFDQMLGGALTYDTEFPQLATLDNMESCFGYWIKTTDPATLVYPEGVILSPVAIVDNTYTRASYIPEVAISNAWVDLYGANVKVDNQLLTRGTLIEAFNETGTLIGNYRVKETGKFGFMPVYGTEILDITAKSSSNGNQITLAINGEKVNETITWTSNGDRLRVNSLTTEKGSSGTLPNSYTLNQNYPNPFNPETSINYTIEKAANVKIEVFNVLGKKITTLVNEYKAAGSYTVKWYALADNGEKAASGLYFYKLTSGDFSEVKKMTLLK